MMRAHGEYKAPGGKLAVVDFDDRDGVITSFQLSGDFFLDPEETLDIIDASIEGLPSRLTARAYAEVIESALPDDAHLLGVTPLGIGIAIRRAGSDAARWRDLDWQVVRTPPLAPVMNVALDEVLLQEVAEGNRGPTMRMWEWDADAVIIGSFQSVANEVDVEQAQRCDTTVIRRISGGGAMYMQPQASISYSLYLPVSFVEGMSFEASYAFLDEWVLEALASLGIDAWYQPLNDITSPGGKIGGAAQKRLASGAVLHHATLAYDMDAERLTRILRVGREKLSDKGTTSAAKRVDPLRSQTRLPRSDIIDHLERVFLQRHGGRTGELTDTEYTRATALVQSKFTSRDWTYRIP